jgi:hypothetical protein
VLSADRQEFERGEHYIWGPVGRRKERVEGVQKIFKEIFCGSGKDCYLCSPARGKREKEKDRRRKAEGNEIKKEDAVQRCDGIPPEAGSVSGWPRSSLKK